MGESDHGAAAAPPLRSGTLLAIALALSSLLLGGAARAEAAGEPCPNEAFRTGASAALADCRAYELVSASFQGGQIPFTSSPAFVSSSSELLLASLGAFGEPGDDPGATGADYRVARQAAGWTATPIEPSAAQFSTAGQITPPLQDASADLESELFAEVPVGAKPVDTRLYVRRHSGAVEQVGPLLPGAAVAAWVPSLAHNPVANYRGASRDLSHTLFSVAAGVTLGPSPVSFLWPGDATARNGSLYEYVGTANAAPRLVGVDNAGHLIGQCGTGLGHYRVVNGEAGSDAVFNAISADGGTVFFTSLAAGTGCTGTAPSASELFARVGGTRTVAISEPSPNGGCITPACTGAPHSGGRFEGASEDGSRVFFTSTQQLLDQASEDKSAGDSADNNEAGGSAQGCSATTGENGCNLYEYEGVTSPAGARLSLVSGGDTSGLGPQVQGVSRISPDGSRVYFVAKGVLSTAANAYGQSAQAGSDNLYVYERDAGFPSGHTTFVARLAGADSEDWSTSDQRPVEATPDGRFLLFASTNALTPDASGSGTQLYRYDAQTGALVRVTIGAAGFADNGNSLSFAGFAAPGYTANGSGAGSGHESAGPQAGSMSSDGQFVFFFSESALTPGAPDRECIAEEEGACSARAINVYEYHEGRVSLISDGQDNHAALGASTVSLIGTSASGGDVFFTTADPLLPLQDTNTQMDVYDARVGGGVPPSAGPAECAAEACRGEAPAAPAFGTPASSVLAGGGDVSAPRAPSGGAAPRPPTRAQKLARALAACRRLHRHARRRRCEAAARRAYGAHPRTGTRRRGTR